jgi:hypothetical protein
VGGGDITKRIKSRATEDFEEKKKWQLDERERRGETTYIKRGRVGRQGERERRRSNVMVA